MSRAVSFNRLAEWELREAALYYETEAAGLGTQFIDSVEAALKTVRDFPQSGKTLRDYIRRKPVDRFPYHLLYRQRDDEIRILAVAHNRRRPFYWAGRH